MRIGINGKDIAEAWARLLGARRPGWRHGTRKRPNPEKLSKNAAKQADRKRKRNAEKRRRAEAKGGKKLPNGQRENDDYCYGNV